MTAMSTRRTALWPVMAVLFGLSMRGLAGFATDHPGPGDFLIDVVNWAALWLVIPLLAGRGARRVRTAATLGMVTAALEIFAFYGAGSLDASFKVAWLVGGSAAAGMLAALAQRLRGRPWSPFLPPALFVVEPALVFVALRLVHRDPWSSWAATAVTEVCVGLVVAAAVGLKVFREASAHEDSALGHLASEER